MTDEIPGELMGATARAFCKRGGTSFPIRDGKEESIRSNVALWEQEDIPDRLPTYLAQMINREQRALGPIESARQLLLENKQQHVVTDTDTSEVISE